MRDREREADCNRGIYRVASIHEHATAYVGSQWLLRYYHRVLGTNRIFSAGGGRESSQCQ